MRPNWFLSHDEICLSRMTQVLFWTIGAIAGALAAEYVYTQPLLTVAVVVVLWAIALAIWKQLAKMMIRRNLPLMIRSRGVRL